MGKLTCLERRSRCRGLRYGSLILGELQVEKERDGVPRPTITFIPLSEDMYTFITISELCIDEQIVDGIPAVLGAIGCTANKFLDMNL
jgi:hypothetical protein